MLQDIRKSSQGTAAKIIVGVIIATFALFGVESIVGSMAGEPEVAAVNGEGVTESSYQRALEMRRRQILAQMGANADPDLIDDALIKEVVLEGLIEQEVLQQDALAKDLYVSDQAIDRYIANIDQFKVDGVFSNDRLQALLRSAGLTLQGYRDSLRTEFMIAQPRSALLASSFYLPQESAELVAIDRQQRSFGSLTIAQADYLAEVNADDSELSEFFDQNQGRYMRDQSVDVAYVEIKHDDLLADIEVSDDELQQLYETEKVEFQSEEERDASHILIAIDDDTTQEQALEKVTALAAQLASGSDFAELAKANSDDEGSASQGGSLGAAAKGVYVSEFEDALFALQEGQVSEPVKTEFGYHLIRLERIVSGNVPAFEELRERLAERLKDQKADQAFAELAEQLSDISYASPDLVEPADELSLQVQNVAAVTASSGHSIFSSPKVQRVLFADELVKEGNNSELIEIAEGHAIVFRVENYNEAGVKALDEVKEDVRTAVLADKASALAESQGKAFTARVSAGEQAAKVAEDMGLNWQRHEGVERNNRELNAELLAKVFALKVDAGEASVAGFVSSQGDYIAAQLVSVEPGKFDSLNAAEQKQITQVLGENVGAIEYRNYQEVAQAHAEIERF